jgi:hypothetical protein
MTKVVKITGVEQAVVNVNKYIHQIKKKTPAGLIAGANHIRRDMDVTQPYIPHDTGEMEKSWEVIVRSTSLVTPLVEAGFYKNYSVYVHENVGATNWTKAGSGPKFLELALKRNTQEIVNIVAKHVSIK